ncbi:hypothetical protein AVEN_184763-1, partial [Araneus ventricosus]
QEQLELKHVSCLETNFEYRMGQRHPRREAELACNSRLSVHRCHRRNAAWPGTVSDIRADSSRWELDRDYWRDNLVL